MIRFRINDKPSESPPRGPDTPGRSLAGRLCKTFLAGGLISLLKRYERGTMKLAQIEADSYYVKGLSKVRSAFIYTIIFSCLHLLLLVGFVFLHAALFIYLSWSVQAKAILLLVLSVVYIMIGLAGIFLFCSQKRWMRFSKADTLVGTVTEK
jgi:hypothetical protein